MAGNQNSGRREKPFYHALMMEIKEAGSDNRKLREIARVLLAKAIEGDMQAMNSLMDRLDGKPMQAIEHSGAIETAPNRITDEELEHIASTSSSGATPQTPGTSKLN